jgi:hypothetical protein
MNRSLTLIVLVALAAGCNRSSTEPAAGGADATAARTSPYVADTKPAGAIAVGEARQTVQDDQTVTLLGVIGGSTEPFVDGLAAFTIVDTKVPYCAPEEGCPTPWDYCCQTDAVKQNIATVKVVDSEGKPVSGDARQLLSVRELSTVVVVGKAERDDQGNLTVAASQVFVQPTADNL